LLIIPDIKYGIPDTEYYTEIMDLRLYGHMVLLVDIDMVNDTMFKNYVKIQEYGSLGFCLIYKRSGQKHRDNGPAVIWVDVIYWYKYGDMVHSRVGI
jgi:hypothetical protein